MASKQTPTPAVFDECVRELKFRIESFPTGNPLRVCPPGDDSGVPMDAHLHVVILEHFVFGIISLLPPRYRPSAW
jgi:hypothetical protein